MAAIDELIDEYLGTKAGMQAQDPGTNEWWDIFDLF